jgi:hypothetical protein
MKEIASWNGKPESNSRLPCSYNSLEELRDPTRATLLISKGSASSDLRSPGRPHLLRISSPLSVHHWGPNPSMWFLGKQTTFKSQQRVNWEHRLDDDNCSLFFWLYQMHLFGPLPPNATENIFDIVDYIKLLKLI